MATKKTKKEKKKEDESWWDKVKRGLTIKPIEPYQGPATININEQEQNPDEPGAPNPQRTMANPNRKKAPKKKKKAPIKKKE